MSTITGEFGELRIDVEQIDVTSCGRRVDETWRYTDQAGHEHYWRDGYPTLVEIVDERYWCDDCEDEHTETHLECPLCGESIVPGTRSAGTYREFRPGRKSITLNGEPISEERANEIIQAVRDRRE
jgi:hypothetical protein